MMRPPCLIVFALALATTAFPLAAHAQDISDIHVEPKHAWSTLDPIEQYAIIRNSDFQSRDNSTYIVDALDDRLTALGRFGYVSLCMKRDFDNPVDMATCQPDIDAFDPAQALAEIAADKKHPEGQHAALRDGLTSLKGKLAERATAVKALLDKDASYKKMFELAASARKDFAAHKNAPLRELVLAMDDARATRSRKALEGCEDKTWKAWTAAVSAIPAKRFSLVYKDVFTEIVEPAAATIVGEPDGYLAAVALSACFGEKPDILVKYVQHALLFWPGYRGPRSASQLAIMQASLTLDDRDSKLEYPRIDRRELFTGNGNGGDLSFSGSSRGPVVSVAPKGALTHVVFGPTKTKETQCADYRAGKRLSRIESGGRLVYEGTCYKYIQVMVTHDPSKPIDTSIRYAASVKAGMIASAVDQSLLIAVPSLTATAPSVVFGAPVK